MTTITPSTTQTNGSTVNSTTTPGLQNSTTPNIGITTLGPTNNTLLIISASVPSGVALILAITLIIVVCRCCKYKRREKKEKPQKLAIGIETLAEARTRSLKGIRLEVISGLHGNENQGYSQANDEVQNDDYYQQTEIRQKPRETTDTIDRWSGWENEKLVLSEDGGEDYENVNTIDIIPKPESVLSEVEGGEEYVNIYIIPEPGVHSEDETDHLYVNVPNVCVHSEDETDHHYVNVPNVCVHSRDETDHGYVNVPNVYDAEHGMADSIGSIDSIHSETYKEKQASEEERFEKEEYNLMLSIREEHEANEKLRSQNARKDQAIKETRERLAISGRNSCLSPEQLPPQNDTEGCHQDKRLFEQSDRQEPFFPAVGDANEMEKKSMNSREEVSSYNVGFSIDRPFIEDLNDPKSAAYRELEKDVTEMMETAIGDDLIEVTIIRFIKGCIEIVSVIKVKKDGNINEAIKEHLRKDSVCQCMKVKETSIYVTESNDEKQEQDENKATNLLQTGDASGDGSIANISAVGGSVTIHQTNNTVVDCEYRAQQAKKIENLTRSLAEERKTREQLQREGEIKDTELAKMKRLLREKDRELREKDGELREKDGELREKDGELREKKGVVDGMVLSLEKLHIDPMCMQLMEDPAKLAKEKNKQQNQIVGTYLNDSV